ncbi:hypothetical protein [Sedimentibacter acidaminivorans]|jgi:hypothetical protein|nr:hypothetical protein [Sedimentibacter acidaminivorans]
MGNEMEEILQSLKLNIYREIVELFNLIVYRVSEIKKSSLVKRKEPSPKKLKGGRINEENIIKKRYNYR